MSRRVVITGLGLVSPFGVGKVHFFQGLRGGQSAIRKISSFDCAEEKVQIAAQVPDFEAGQYVSEVSTVKRSNRVTLLALVSARLTLDDAGLPQDNPQRRNIGVSLGTGMGGMQTTGEAYYDYLVTKRSMSPIAIPMAMANAAASQVSILYQLQGPNVTTSTACSASGQATGLAYEYIRAGMADRMLAGGSEAPIFPGSLNAWASTRVMSTENETPERACRPFSKNRPGMVLGEGACTYLLEERQAALSRGARIYAEIVGWASNADAHNITAPKAEGQVAAMQTALARSGLTPDRIDYVAAHGTGTRLNDKTETAAVKQVFETQSQKLPVSSIKSMLGHTLGASSAFGLASGLLALNEGILPPTINLEEADPECDLDYVPQAGRRHPVQYAMINSFAFGGSNATLILQAAETSQRRTLDHA